MTITTRAISNTFTRDFSVSKQVALGIADYEAQDDDGHVAFGHSEAEAVTNLKNAVAV
tara:strand:- start:1247 stop:1420 length:174 start_codon:yes stop_codon:yes gene_type:complete